MAVTAGTVCARLFPVCARLIQEEIFEWKINDFFQLEGLVVDSPIFCFSNTSWKIAIYFYDLKTNHPPRDYISLDVYPVSYPKPSTVTMTLSFKTVNGKRDLEHTSTLFIDKKYFGFKMHKVMSRSELIRRQSELLPSGTLTVICTLKKGEPNVVNEHKLLDASAQTGETTGVWKLQKQLREISLSGDISDVILKVGEKEFKSHRCILAARSPVFLAMMKSEMKENVTGVVDIEDVDPKTFSDFLNYLYTGSTEDLRPENASKLYTVADKYQVEELKENCLDHMLVNVSVENFCDVFMLSIQHSEEMLKETCFQYFAKHYLDIIQTCKWQSFLCENPIICNELFIKQAKLNNKNTST